MITRNGKIAHLPRTLRDDLNQRIDNGIPGHKLLEWLNANPEVRGILAEYFPGTRISQQNLSDWRQGGYQDWVKLQQTNELTLKLAQESSTLEADLGAEFNAQKITDSLKTIAIAEFACTSRKKLHECIDTQERWTCISETMTQLSRLRDDDTRAANTALRQEIRDHDLAAEHRSIKQAAEAEVRAELLAHLNKLGLGRADLPVRPNIPTLPRPTQDTQSSIQHPSSRPSQPATHAIPSPKNHIKNAHIPGGTSPNQENFISSPVPICRNHVTNQTQAR